MEELKQYLLLNPDSTHNQIYQTFKIEIWDYLNEQGLTSTMLKRLAEDLESGNVKIYNKASLLSAIAKFACSIVEEETKELNQE